MSVQEILNDINRNVSQIEEEMKQKMSAYNKIRSAVEQNERKMTGNLIVRNIADLVREEHFIVGSEYLRTLIVVVPTKRLEEWFATYETLTEFIVPKSSMEIYREGDSALVNVTMFDRVVDDFKNKAREIRFVVKDFEWDAEAVRSQEKRAADAKTEMQKKFNALASWCQTMFGEAFVSWTHIKALRIFVESVLRYGLPVNFTAFRVQGKLTSETPEANAQGTYKAIIKGTGNLFHEIEVRTDWMGLASSNSQTHVPNFVADPSFT